VNKAQLVEALSERLDNDKKRAQASVEAFLDTVYRTVQKGEKVAITGFGVFEKRERAARMARNPATGEKVRVKKTSVPAFRPGQEFKDVVSGAKKLPKAAKTTKTTAAKAAAKTTGTKAAAKAPAKAAKTTTRKAPAKKA
jgi:DNA-binding protein HU-beta